MEFVDLFGLNITLEATFLKEENVSPLFKSLLYHLLLIVFYLFIGSTVFRAVCLFFRPGH